ncbi:MAG: exopolysaccharide biosynthesis polyprenyl glycosylphosphotransferase [bacterium]
MTIINKKEPIFVGFGDIVVLVIALWLTLAFRYESFPSMSVWISHLLPFSLIFVYSLIVFYIAGLYGRYNVFVRGRIPSLLVKSQIINVVLAVILFYFTPDFDISPKTTLFIYFIISTAFIVAWRVTIFSFSDLRVKRRALIISTTNTVVNEATELCHEMNTSSHSSLECAGVIDSEMATSKEFRANLLEKIKNEHISYVVLDMSHPTLEPLLPELYKAIFQNVSFVDIYALYEQMFGRIPLSSLKYAWVLENVSPSTPRLYDALKRAIDIVLSLVLALITLVVWPFVWAAIKLDDRGTIFTKQSRVGKNDQAIQVYKFRTMNRTDGGRWVAEADNDNKVTRVGYFLRKSRIDELPQVWSVLKGDLSLIGPRWDIKGLKDTLEKQIPYYGIRTIVKPGLSGWAQVNQEKPPQSLEETKARLSYDLYYIKNRSLGLDIQIALKTIKTLLSLVGM